MVFVCSFLDRLSQNIVSGLIKFFKPFYQFLLFLSKNFLTFWIFLNKMIDMNDFYGTFQRNT